MAMTSDKDKSANNPKDHRGASARRNTKLRSVICEQPKMSPELETLDQLQGGDLPLGEVRKVFNDDGRFSHAVFAMLDAGEVRMLSEGSEVPRWQWRQLLTSPSQSELSGLRLAITAAGAKRIG
jgi:hypothetical protein